MSMNENAATASSDGDVGAMVKNVGGNITGLGEKGLRVCVTGGMGYVGSWMIPHLLADGHIVKNLDISWFGDGFLPKDNDNYIPIVGDIRDPEKLKEAFKDCDAVIHMACVSNDTSCQLDEKLSTSINFDAFEPLVIAAKAAGVRRFIYCSSSSVYGVSDEPHVTEDHPLIPLTLYNRYKGECEPILFRHQSRDFVCTIIRPATVCGYAPRMRFDLTVNIMTNHAVQKKLITVFGGEQRRPNLHIKDMTRCYQLMLTAPDEKIAGQIFNVGHRNMKVKDIAELVAKTVGDHMGYAVGIETKASTDNRSYHIDASKIKSVLGFEPQFTVEDAIVDMLYRFKAGAWKDSLENPWYTNILQLQAKGIA